MQQRKLIKEFPNKFVRTQGTEQTFEKKLQETDRMARRSGSIESIQNISCFSIL